MSETDTPVRRASLRLIWPTQMPKEVTHRSVGPARAPGGLFPRRGQPIAVLSVMPQRPKMQSCWSLCLSYRGVPPVAANCNCGNGCHLFIGTMFYIFYYYYAAESPLWEAMFTSGLLGLVNVSMILVVLLERSTVGMGSDAAVLYGFFQNLSPGQCGLEA